MSSFDWNQFEEVPSRQSSSKSSKFDWNQFEQEEPVPVLQSLKGHAERKIGGPALEFVTKAFTAVPNFIDSVQKAGVKGFNKIIQKAGLKGLPEDQLEKVYKSAKMFGPTAQIPEAEELLDKIHEQTGGKFKPITPGERKLQKGAGIAGSITGFGPSAALGTPLRAAGTLAGAATMGTLEEEGANPWLSAGGGILADILTRSAGTGIKKLAGLVGKGIPKIAGESIAKLGKIKPSQINDTVIEAAKRLGIETEQLPLSAQMNNPFLQGIETRLRQSSLAGKSLGRQLSETGEKLKGTYEDIASQLSSRKENLPSVVSGEAVTELQKIQEAGEREYRRLYLQSEKLLPDTAVTEQRMGLAIKRVVDSVMKKLSSDLGTPSKDALHKRLQRLVETWEKNPEIKQGKIPISRLIDLKKDLNQVIKYETRGGADKLVEPLAGITRNAIQEYGKNNAPFLFRFNEAERIFGKNVRDFRKNPLIKNLVQGQNPEQIIGKMNTVKGIREMEKIFSETSEGKEAFNSLKRYKLEQLLSNKMLDKNGNISWGKATGMLKDPKTRDLVRELVGQKNFNQLKDITAVSRGVEEGLRKFLNTSNTATAHFDTALLIGVPLKAMALLFSGRPFKAALTASGLITPKILSDLMVNPEFIKAVKGAAHASRSSNAKLFMENIKRAAAFVVAEISGGDNKKEDQENQSDSEST